MSSRHLVARVLGAIDSGDSARFADALVPEVVFRFGNAPPVHGVAAVRATVEQFLAGLGAIAHEVSDVREMGDAIFAHGSVTYTRTDGSTLKVPFATLWYLDGGLIRDYLIFVDISTL